MVSEHAILYKGELEKMTVVKLAEVIGQFRREACACKAPVILIRMAALEAADQQIVHAGSSEDAEAVNKGSLAKGPCFPVAFTPAGHDDDLRVSGVVGGVELVNREELAVRTGNRSHGHNAAGLVPDLLEEFAFFGEEIAGIVLLCCYDKTVLALNGDFGHGVAFVQVRNNFLCNVHIFCPFICESDVPFKTITKTIAQTNIYLQKQSKARSKKNKNCVFKNNPGKVVTAEEHNIIGGLGGAVAECLAEKCPTKMYRIGVRDKFGESGSAAGVLI